MCDLAEEELLDLAQHMESLGVVVLNNSSLVTGGGTTPRLEIWDLVCVPWVGRDPHPVCQLLAGHQSSRRKTLRSNNFAQHGGAWCHI